MISVNQKFKDSCNKANVQSQFKLYLSENKNSNVLATLNDDEFIIDSGSIEKQASSGAVLNIGGVCSNRIKITLTQKGVEKVNNVNGFKKNYALHLVQWNRVDDANQSPSDFSKNLDDSENITGKCDLGFYYISEIDNNYYSCVLTCYDGMIAFQRNFTITQIKYLKNNSKTVDEWLAYFCSLVNDSNFLISYTDNTEVTCNDGVSFSLSDDVDFDTMREAISQLAMLKMAYATIDSLGNLTLKPAIKTNTSTYDDTVANQYMFSCDNEVKESVIKYFYTSVAGFEYENTYQDQEGRNEINIYLEENKFLRGFEPYNGSAMSSSSLTCLRNMAQAVMGYSFYSCECEVNERPYIELGDNIQVQRRLVDTEGTVTQISIPVVVDNLSHSLGSTTHLSSNSTVSTNSSSSGKMNLNGGGNVNSKIKEPSASDVYNTITDETTSPVTKYTDTTATIRIRMDDNNVTEYFDNNALMSNYKSEGEPQISSYADSHSVSHYWYHYSNTNATAYNDRQILYKRTCPEYTKGKYIFDSNFVRTLNNKLVAKYRVRGRKNESFINSLIGLELPLIFDNHQWVCKVTSVSVSTSKEKIKYTAYNEVSSAVSTQQTFMYNNNKVNSDTIQTNVIAELGTVSSYNKTEKYENSTQLPPLLGVEGINGYSVYSDVSYAKYDGTDSDYCYPIVINPYITNIHRFVKASTLFPVNISLTYTVIECDGSSDPSAPYVGDEYDDYATAFLFDGIKSSGIETEEEFNTRLQNRASFINQYTTALNKLCDAMINYYSFNIDNYILEVTYTTNDESNPVPISDADKSSVDNGIVTTEDFADLSGQVNANTQAISDLKEDLASLDTKLSSDINDVNNDLQDTKQDIATNTQNIATNAGNIAALDDRVDALEGNAVEANPSDNPTATLTKLKVNDVVYDVPSGGGGGGGTTVIANPSGQASADLEKLQVGNIIYGIPSGGGGASHDELIVTSEHNITLLGNGRTHMNYDKILYQEGDSFINYDVTTGFWTVSEDTLMSVEIQSNIESYGNAWLTYRIFEANTANINDTTGTQGQIYYCYTFGFTEFPIIKCKPNYYYFVAAYKANSGNWTMTKSEYDSTTGLYQMKNFAKFVKKNGIYTPT